MWQTKDIPLSTIKTKDIITYLSNKEFLKKKCMQNVSTNLRIINGDPIGIASNFTVRSNPLCMRVIQCFYSKDTMCCLLLSAM